ncbi:MAG TPA: hypothetical protein VHN80_02360, partial [Kineosporiaceae bacterium]|nr:hypothetical protein [Kineosporiaceae bacterium]
RGHAVRALAVAPEDFTVAQFSTKVAAMTGRTDADYTTRQGAYDLRKLRGKQLVAKPPGRTRRYQVPEAAARTIAALLTIRDQGRSTIPCLCGGWCGGEAEVLEKGVHVDAQSLVVAVDPGPGGRWAAPPRGADSGEARRDDPGRSPRR